MINKDVKANRTAFIITLFSLLLLVISSVFTLFTRISDKDVQAMEAAAQKLIIANFDSVSYFRLASLPALEGYDPAQYPENVIPCDTKLFADYQALRNFVGATYAPAAAVSVLNTETNGAKRYFDYNGQLCMAYIEPDLTYDRDWSSVRFTLSAIRRKSADIHVTIPVKSGTEATLELKMAKLDGQWRLLEMVY